MPAKRNPKQPGYLTVDQRGNLKVAGALSDQNQVERDPIDALFDGVQFRNGGRSKAVSAVRTFVAAQVASVLKDANDRHEREVKGVREDAKTDVAYRDANIQRLEGALRRMATYHGEEITHLLSRRGGIPAPPAGEKMANGIIFLGSDGLQLSDGKTVQKLEGRLARRN